MWHVETDVFALVVFLIMLIKEAGLRKERRRKLKLGIGELDVQSSSFFYLLVFSIIGDGIDILSSIAMNCADNWWLYQIFMTIYVASMPLLAVVWVSYAYVIIHSDYSLKRLLRWIGIMVIPYILYILVALSNPFTGLFFKLSSDMEYERGILFMPVGVGFIMLYSALGLFLAVFNWKKIEPRVNGLLLFIFFAITGTFTWVQLAHPGWLIINASYAVIYILCDVTVEDGRRKKLYQEIHQKNEELEILAKKAESAANAKSEFLSRMSHDIRTPMNAIIGLTHLAKYEDDVQTIKEYLGKIESSSKFLLGLINDILDLSKIENGEMSLHEGPFSKEEFIDSIQTVIKPLIDEKNIKFVFDLRDDIPCINVDRLRFSQIFFNLLSNAVKFTPMGGIIEFTAERFGDEENGENGEVGIRFHVKDNGIGMSQEFQEHLYDPFVQEESKLSEKTRGTGLGLPIVKSLVDAMGGTISVNSVIGKGTDFIVDLYVHPAEVQRPIVDDSNDEKSLDGMKILLVEDNELNVYVATIVLEKLLCSVDTAENGQKAIEMFEHSEEKFYDAVLMDVHMPIMDGLEATRRIRALDREDASMVPIIAMTADAFDKEKQETVDAGMNDHLAKPIEPSTLYKVLLKYKRA